MKISVWYMKPDWFPKGIFGEKPDPANLQLTHVHVLDLDGYGPEEFETIYRTMQAEQWSPNGEACGLIERKGLSHTSMSMGDVLVAGDKVFIVAKAGFEEIGPFKDPQKLDVQELVDTMQEVGIPIIVFD